MSEWKYQFDKESMKDWHAIISKDDGTTWETKFVKNAIEEIDVLNSEITALRKQLEDAREVIEFYADDKNWIGECETRTDDGYYLCLMIQSDSYKTKVKREKFVFGGKRARSHLAKFVNPSNTSGGEE